MQISAGPAAAILVKTVGLSPVKSRLAATIGTVAAEAFYNLSCQAIEEVLREVPQLQAYWAVAETAGESHISWQGLPILKQGEGGLGERLDCVYRQLLGRHSQAILLGADAPQLAPELLEAAIEAGREGRFVLGPALDGGFYLFAGCQALPSQVWTNVSYSRTDTLEQLLFQIGTEVPVYFLPPLQDVDEKADLQAVMSFLAENKALLPCQKSILDWYLHLQKPSKAFD